LTTEEYLKDRTSIKHKEQAIFKSLWRMRGDLILLLVFILITALYALLMVRDRIPLEGFLILAGAGLLYWVLTGRLSYASPMDMLILGLLGLLPLTAWVSIDPTLTLPNIYGLVLGIALFYVIINWLRHTRRLPLVILALTLLAIAIAALGLVGTDWKTSRFQGFNPIFDLLPNWVATIPGNLAGVGINPNTLGGALVFFPPLLLSLLWDKGGYQRMFLGGAIRHKRTLNRIYKFFLVFALFVVTFTLVLTQSRGAYLGAIVGLFAVLTWKDRRYWWLVLLFVLGIITWQVLDSWSLFELRSSLDLTQESTLGSRLTLWWDSVYILQDFPLTGVGLNTFNPVRNGFYRLSIFENKDPLYFHAHNTLLTVAVEMGLPALILYTAFLSSFGWMAWRVYKKGRSFTRSLTAGLTCGLAAHQAFGIMDAYTLGKKLGIVMWIFFGLMTALFIHRRKLSRSVMKRSEEDTVEVRLKLDKKGFTNRILLTLVGFGLWAAFSVVAVSLVNLNPYLALVSAIPCGIILGIFITRRFWEKNRKSQKRPVSL
jgi:O-antigen ligase